MPAHLWEAAKRDVRGVIPDWLRSAKENGAEAPPHIREVARRAARAGAGLGMAIAVGSQVEGLAGQPDGAAVVPVAQVTAEVPPGLAPGAPAAPATGDSPALAEAFRVPAPDGTDGGWLNVEMYQDVVVNEGAEAMHNVDAFQYLVISDDVGQSYVFKEHHHATVSEPPVRETDLLIHERSQVHVVENTDGSFSMATVGYDRSVQGIGDDAPADTVPGDGVELEAPAPEALGVPPGIDFPPPPAEPVPVAAGEEPDALDAPARALSVVEVGDIPPDRHEDTAPDRHEGTDDDHYEAAGTEPDDHLTGNDPPDEGDLAV